MEYQLEQATRILVRTPDVLRALLKEAGPEWTHTNYGENTFSPYDVLGHLIHGERTDWIPRARIILEFGESKPFDPFDRFAMLKSSDSKSILQLLDEFELARARSLRELKEMHLTPALLQRQGLHPSLGTVTLANHLSMWVVHDLGHLAQVARSMAWQYRDAIGPWRESTSIVRLEGDVRS